MLMKSGLRSIAYLLIGCVLFQTAAASFAEAAQLPALQRVSPSHTCEPRSLYKPSASIEQMRRDFCRNIDQLIRENSSNEQYCKTLILAKNAVAHRLEMQVITQADGSRILQGSYQRKHSRVPFSAHTLRQASLLAASADPAPIAAKFIAAAQGAGHVQFQRPVVSDTTDEQQQFDPASILYGPMIALKNHFILRLNFRMATAVNYLTKLLVLFAIWAETYFFFDVLPYTLLPFDGIGGRLVLSIAIFFLAHLFVAALTADKTRNAMAYQVSFAGILSAVSLLVIFVTTQGSDLYNAKPVIEWVFFSTHAILNLIWIVLSNPISTKITALHASGVELKAPADLPLTAQQQNVRDFLIALSQTRVSPSYQMLPDMQAAEYSGLDALKYLLKRQITTEMLTPAFLDEIAPQLHAYVGDDVDDDDAKAATAHLVTIASLIAQLRRQAAKNHPRDFLRINGYWLAELDLTSPVSGESYRRIKATLYDQKGGLNFDSPQALRMALKHPHIRYYDGVLDANLANLDNWVEFFQIAAPQHNARDLAREMLELKGLQPGQRFANILSVSELEYHLEASVSPILWDILRQSLMFGKIKFPPSAQRDPDLGALYDAMNWVLTARINGRTIFDSQFELLSLRLREKNISHAEELLRMAYFCGPRMYSSGRGHYQLSTLLNILKTQFNAPPQEVERLFTERLVSQALAGLVKVNETQGKLQNFYANYGSVAWVRLAREVLQNKSEDELRAALSTANFSIAEYIRLTHFNYAEEITEFLYWHYILPELLSNPYLLHKPHQFSFTLNAVGGFEYEIMEVGPDEPRLVIAPEIAEMKNDRGSPLSLWRQPAAVSLSGHINSPEENLPISQAIAEVKALQRQADATREKIPTIMWKTLVFLVLGSALFPLGIFLATLAGLPEEGSISVGVILPILSTISVFGWYSSDIHRGSEAVLSQSVRNYALEKTRDRLRAISWAVFTLVWLLPIYFVVESENRVLQVVVGIFGGGALFEQFLRSLYVFNLAPKSFSQPQLRTEIPHSTEVEMRDDDLDSQDAEQNFSEVEMQTHDMGVTATEKTEFENQVEVVYIVDLTQASDNRRASALAKLEELSQNVRPDYNISFIVYTSPDVAVAVSPGITLSSDIDEIRALLDYKKATGKCVLPLIFTRNQPSWQVITANFSCGLLGLSDLGKPAAIQNIEQQLLSEAAAAVSQ